MKLAILIVAAMLLPIMPVHAGTGVPPACEGGADTDRCIDFNISARLGLARYRLDHDLEVASGAPIAHRSDAQKAEVWRLETIFWKVERENEILKRRRCRGR